MSVPWMRKGLAMLLMLLLIFPVPGQAEEDEEELIIEEYVLLTDDGEEIPDLDAMEDAVATPVPELTPRDDFIDRMVQLGEKLYDKANGRAQRAHYASDIYVCKNFTVYLFRENRDAFRMAEYPDVRLRIPNNMPARQCKPYAYGLAWEEIDASEGNPFYAAAEFRYDPELSKEENMEKALAFMREVRRGDFMQMSADYEYGVGAHSAIFISDYDPATDTVHWMDSNMRGKKVNGIRYGIVQFNEEKSIEWWASCFCKKTRGATLYRLRDDIIYAD